MTTETSIEDELRRRLLAKVVIPDDPDACWEWTGAVNKNGRAHMQADKRGTYSNASRQAAVIRSSKERSRVLADRYGLSMSHIAHIRKGNFWKER